jgi:hypothetical protein
MSRPSRHGASLSLHNTSYLGSSSAQRSTHQGCEQVSYDDVPSEAKADVAGVFDVSLKLPKSWVDKVRLFFIRRPVSVSKSSRIRRVIGSWLAWRRLRSSISFKMHTKKAPHCSAIRSTSRTSRDCTAKSLPYMLRGDDSGGCERRRRSGVNTTSPRTCKFLCRSRTCSRFTSR